MRWVGDEPSPPEPLVGDGIMHPEGVTLIYGPGGIGKGMITLHVIKHLQHEGFVPVVLDYESNAWEWAHRAYSMGLRFQVDEPELGVLTLAEGRRMGDLFAAEGITHVILDSATTAKPRARENDFGAADSTVDFFRSVRAMGIPVLMIGHQGKEQTKHPTPMGSAHFITQSRLVYRAISDRPGAVRIVCEKANDRDKVALGAEFIIKGTSNSLTIERRGVILTKPDADEKEATVPERIVALLSEGMEYSAGDIAEIMLTVGWAMPIDSLRVVLGRMVAAGTLQRIGRGRYMLSPENLT